MRWIFRIFGALVLAFLVLVGGLLLLPGEKIAQVVVDQIRNATGREVSFEGDVSISFYPVLGVKTGPVTIANADWSENGAMLEAEALSIGVETIPLLSGQIRIKKLEIASPSLLLERDSAGRGNWEIEAGTGGSSGRQFALSLDHLEMTGGRVRYLDHSDGSKQEFSGLNAVLKAPDLEGPAELSLSLSPAGETVTLAANVGGILPFVSGKPVPLVANMQVGGGKVGFEGRASAAGDAEGRVAVDLPSTARALSALGMGAVAPPKGMGQAVKLSGLLVVTEGKAIALRKGSYTLDQNSLSGDIDIKVNGDRPNITARLSAGDLDFAGVSGGGGASSAGWSKAPIDAGALGFANGQARITAKSVDLGTLKFGASDVTLSVERSRAVFTLNSVAGYSGGFSGEFVANNRSGLSVGGTLSAKGVEMQSLLSDLFDVTRLSGKGDGRISFLGVGQSVDAIMKSLKGDGAVSMAGGKFAGFDLDKLMNTGDGSGGTTIFNTLGASFSMAGGNMANDDLKLVLPNVEATGKGRIGLGARDIDYLFTPVALKGRKGKGLAFPVRIKGPWSAPGITPDVKAAIDLNLAEEKKALEEKAKEKVKDKLSQELGVDVKEGEKVEDALKRKAEEEVKKGLLKLLE